MKIGKWSILYTRLKGHLTSLIHTPILLFLLIRETGWLWWYGFIILAAILIVYFDDKTVIAQERDYIWTRPGKLNDMRLEIKEILKMLKKENDSKNI